MKVAVLGAGSWGTALALQLARLDAEVHLWDRDTKRAGQMESFRENRRYLPGCTFPDNITVTGSLETALSEATLVIVVVPSQSVREVMKVAQPHLSDSVVICCASKGIEANTLMTMAEVLEAVLPIEAHNRVCVLTGPSFAKEVAVDLPTAVLVAGKNERTNEIVIEALHGGNFRVYHTDDIIGAELGGALKNIVAIACGISDGIGLGLNARAALMTRGLAEIGRLAVARGANPLTMAGLAGMGDLVLTCTGNLSRNRRLGLGLGQGKSLQEVLSELGQVAEGVETARSAHHLARRTGVEMPITDQIFGILHENKSAVVALRDLLDRRRKAERD